MSDDMIGRKATPPHYSGRGREPIDEIRDSMPRESFIDFCRGQFLRYRARAGKKGPADEDEEKARFYAEMLLHVSTGEVPDPRSDREGFEPYTRQAMPHPIVRTHINVLDHGYVRLIESWGRGKSRIPEAGIIEAARQSTDGSFRGWRRDAGLLRYLHEHKHSTPFEFAGMVIEVQAPIFIFRQWHRHRVQSYNELSARYTSVPDVSYLPTAAEVHRRSVEAAAVKNKQAGTVTGAPTLTLDEAALFVEGLRRSYAAFDSKYAAALEGGVPKELARLGMPVGRYSRMRASAVLRNWLAFLTLRMDPHAQWEIRQYANAVFTIVQEEFPRTAELFGEGLPEGVL